MSSSISEQQKRSLSASVLDADCIYEMEDGQLMVSCVLHNLDVAVGTTSICECVVGEAPVEVIAYRYAKRGGRLHRVRGVQSENPVATPGPTIPDAIHWNARMHNAHDIGAARAYPDAGRLAAGQKLLTAVN